MIYIEDVDDMADIKDAAEAIKAEKENGMKVLGIVVEYNPFHFGHLNHLHQSIELVRPEYVVAVMSGKLLSTWRTCDDKQSLQGRKLH